MSTFSRISTRLALLALVTIPQLVSAQAIPYNPGAGAIPAPFLPSIMSQILPSDIGVNMGGIPGSPAMSFETRGNAGVYNPIGASNYLVWDYNHTYPTTTAGCGLSWAATGQHNIPAWSGYTTNLNTNFIGMKVKGKTNEAGFGFIEESGPCIAPNYPTGNALIYWYDNGTLPSNRLVFANTNGSSTKEQATILSDGKFGIGLNAPQSQLHVNTFGSVATYACFTNTPTGTGTLDGFKVGIEPTTNPNAVLNNQELGDMVFKDNDREAIRINNRGTLRGLGESWFGIGTTK